MKWTRICFSSIVIQTLMISFVFSTSSFSLGQDRPPAVPLVVHDPYFSIWSCSDCLTDSETKHWTGKDHPLHMMIRLDDKTFRLMGAEPSDVPAMEQKNLIIMPSITTYQFENRDARVTLNFITPLLPSNLDWLSRPATYITVDILLKNNTISKAVLYFDAGAEIAVNTPDQSVEWSFLDIPETKTVRVGTVEQDILGQSGDDVRIDWGHLILSVQDLPMQKMTYQFVNDLQVGNGTEFRRHFIENGNLSSDYSLDSPRSVEEEDVVLATVFSIIDGKRHEIIHINYILAYDDLYSIRYFGQNLRPWWKRDGKTTEEMIREAWLDIQGNNKLQIEPIFSQCKQFNNSSVSNEIIKIGGPNYAKLCSLAYRQVLGAQKIVADANGMPLMFSKENFSNGCIGTVDIMYPSSPFFLYYSPMLLKATLEPIMAYAASEYWKFPFAPHDLGTYPWANGQVYGGGEKTEENQMPVEETANMLIMFYALSTIEKNADYAAKYWETLTKWGEYLKEKGFDPENQLCTDDFAGHLPHNTNLSVKAIIGLASYSRMAQMLGKDDIADEYWNIVKQYAEDWVVLANDGDHFRLTFDKPDTWSMKYNLMWDRVLQMGIFPPEVIDKELTFYQTKMEEYGLPLDSRSLYTKIDWILWTAAMTHSRDEFKSFVDPVIRYLNQTPQRVPIGDWYWADSAKHCAMQARSVVGGFWAPLLCKEELLNMRLEQAATVEGTWAPLPKRELNPAIE